MTTIAFLALLLGPAQTASARPTAATVAMDRMETVLKDHVRLCNKGSLDHCVEAGRIHVSGGVPDLAKAQALFEQACRGGQQSGCFRLGNIYYFGQGVSVDKGRARSLYDRACAGNVFQACNNLGLLQLEDGPTLDKLSAATLFRKACDGGEMKGCRNLATMHVTRAAPLMDPNLGWNLYRQACRGGDTESCDVLRRTGRAGS